MSASPIANTMRAGWWTNLVHHPRRTWLRRAVFQVHLWAGLLVGLLATVVGVSGSAVVYREALARRLSPELFRTAPGPALPADTLLAAAQQAAPACIPQDVDIQAARNPWVLRTLCGAHRRYIYIDPATGKTLGVRGEQEGIVNWLDALHTDLLAGERGQWVNGVGGALLFLMCATGVVVWWPGRGRMRRALRIHWRARPRRLNYDLHTAGGFWIVLPLAFEALTGAFLCFGFAYLLPLLGGHKGDFEALFAARPVQASRAHVPLESLIERSRQIHPEAKELYLELPNAPTQALTAITRSAGESRMGLVSVLAFDPHTGALIKSVSSTQIAKPLRIALFFDAFHFGLIGGNITMVLWVLLGLTPGVLFFSGLLMWWLRVLRPRL